MYSKIDEQLIEITKLFNEFFIKLTQLGLVCFQTHQIFLDPIYVKGSTNPVERQFMEQQIQKNGENPFTKKAMSLDDLRKTPSSLHILEKIQKEIQQFLTQYRKHPYSYYLEQLISTVQYKKEEPDINDIFNSFLKYLEKKGLYFPLTGCILHDPIIINGSKSPVERQFVEQAIVLQGTNPFTREIMSLEELTTILTEEKVQEQITQEIEFFLLIHKNHSQIIKLKQLIKNERYTPAKALLQPPPAASAPSNPTEDDLLAMRRAARTNTDSNQIQRNEWTKLGTWNIITPSEQVTQSVLYVKNNSNHIYDLELRAYSDGDLGVKVSAGRSAFLGQSFGFHSTSIFPERSMEHNVCLMSALETNFNRDIPYIRKFPSINECNFKFKAPPEYVMAVLPLLFECIERVEGPNSTGIKDEIIELINSTPSYSISY
jgi:hypothetical protein